MTDEPTLRPDGDDPDDVTAEQARELTAFFDDLLVDEPPATVTPLTVLTEARRAEQSSRPAAARNTERPERSRRTARKVRNGLLAAAAVAVVVSGTVLAIRSGGGNAQTASPTSAAATTVAASSAAASSGAESSAAGTSTAAPASSASSSSLASSGATTVPSACGPTSADLPTVRTALRGTSLAGARINFCRDPAALPASGESLVLNIRTATPASCTRLRPACTAVAGISSAYATSTPQGVRIWIYGSGYELVVISASPLSGGQISGIVTDARRVLAALT